MNTATTNFVRGNARGAVARPEPPHRDRRLKRQRTRGAQKRTALREQA